MVTRKFQLLLVPCKKNGREFLWNLSSRFRILLRTLELDVENASGIVRVCVALHNFLITKQDKAYITPGLLDTEDSIGSEVPGTWRNLVENQDVCTLTTNQSDPSSSLSAHDVRDSLKEYFYDKGAIEFQWQMIE